MTLDVFFDYTCPFCMRGHKFLEELLPRFPQLQPDWRPCEAHPRPDRYGLHSDLCARGMYYALDRGVDLADYNNRMYRAAQVDRLNIEDPRVVAEVMADLLDPAEFREVLSGGAYLDNLLENNQAAWQTHQFAAIPSLVCGDKQLRCDENIGLDKEQIQKFLSAL